MAVDGLERGHGFAMKCGVGFFPVHNPYCYEPISESSKFFWKLRINFDGGFGFTETSYYLPFWGLVQVTNNAHNAARKQ
jgi:hypothetical protein